MKNPRLLFISFMTLCLLVSSCEKPSEEGLVLIADKTGILADGQDAAVFTVKLNGEDITSMQGVSVCMDSGMCLMCREGKFSFTTDIPGEYSFTATYQEEHSAPVVITAEAIPGGNPEDPEEPDTPEDPDEPVVFEPSKVFHKNVMYMTFTATWCRPCYLNFKLQMAKFLEDEEHADHVTQINIHTRDDIDSTQFPYDLADQLAADGRWEVMGFPTTIVDFRRKGSSITADWLYCMEFQAMTAMKVQSSYDDGNVSVDVAMGVKTDGDYRLVAALVEDGVIAYQEGYGEGYSHTNVLRYISEGGLFGGDADIALSAGDETVKSFSFDIDEDRCNVPGLSVIVYSLRLEDGVLVADNSVKVPVGDSSDYRYDE